MLICYPLFYVQFANSLDRLIDDDDDDHNWRAYAYLYVGVSLKASIGWCLSLNCRPTPRIMASVGNHAPEISDICTFEFKCMIDIDVCRAGGFWRQKASTDSWILSLGPLESLVTVTHEIPDSTYHYWYYNDNLWCLNNSHSSLKLSEQKKSNK